MASMLGAVRQRLLAILTGGRGVDGSLGTPAQQRSIPVGRYRENLGNVPLEDIDEGAAFVDRSLELRWVEMHEVPEPQNSLDVIQLRELTFVLRVGYVAGRGQESFVNVTTVTGESKDDALVYPDERAMMDAERIGRALCFSELFQGGTTPAILDCARVTGCTVRQVRAGRFLSETHFRVLIQIDSSENYDP